MWLSRKKESSKDTQVFLPLNSVNEFDMILAAKKSAIFFKHSSRCSISITAYNRVKNYFSEKGAEVHLIDVINHRDVSIHAAKSLDIIHESPQMIQVENGKVIQHASHLNIYPKDFIGN